MFILLIITDLYGKIKKKCIFNKNFFREMSGESFVLYGERNYLLMNCYFKLFMNNPLVFFTTITAFDIMIHRNTEIVFGVLGK